MKNIIGSIISIILVLSFAMGIYCAGTNKTYDFYTHLQVVSMVADDVPTIEELGYIWTADEIGNYDGDLSIPPSVYKYISLNRWPDSGVFAPTPISEDSPYATYWFAKYYQDDWGVFEPIKDFMNGYVNITARVYYSTLWVGNYVLNFFELISALTPTSGLVERGAY